MQTISTIKQLSSTLSAFDTKPNVIIGIDGIDGVGKTTLAAELASLRGWKVIHLDEHLAPDKGTFVNHLAYSDIQLEIEATHLPILIEGVCLLDVAEKLGVHLSSHVYVKRVDRYGIWADQDECDFSAPFSLKVSTLEEQVRLLVGDTFGGLTDFRKEVIEYHARRKPSNAADVVFERHEATENVK